MSKRSSRRLAVVAGAALALGSMAPALAVRVDGNATGNVSVDSDLDLDDISAPALPDVEGIVADVEATVADAQAIAAQAQLQVDALATAAGQDLANIQAMLDDLVAGALGSVTIDADAGTPGVVKVTVDASGALGVVDTVNGTLEDPEGAVNAAIGAALGLQTVGEVDDTVGMVTGIATDAVSDIDVDALAGTVLAPVGGLLNGGLPSIPGLSGGVTVNVLASLLANF